MYRKLDSCKLDCLIEKVYGVDFCSAATWLEGSNRMQVPGVSPEAAESDDWCRQKLEDDDNGVKWDLSMPPLSNYILNDLCAKGKLKSGDYIIIFDN